MKTKKFLSFFLTVLILLVLAASCSENNPLPIENSPTISTHTTTNVSPESTASPSQTNSPALTPQTVQTTIPPATTHTTNTIQTTSPVQTFTPLSLKAQYQAKTIYLTSYSDLDLGVTLASLQGLLANKGTEQILINIGAYSKFAPYIKNTYGATVISSSIWSTVEKFKDKVSGYILCDNVGSDESLNVATSIANQLDAIIVTKKYEQKVISLGYTKILDVTGKNNEWLRESQYFSKLNKKIALSQGLIFGPHLRDYAVMKGAYSYYASTTSDNMRNFSFLDNNSLVFGWNDALGEYDTVASFSTINANLIPANHAHNLSTLSGFKLDSIKQKRSPVSNKTHTGKHTVCFIMSDGDNLQYLLNNYTDTNWFGSPLRSSFNMGWGLPPLTIDLAPPMLNYMYDEMNTSDEFVMQIGGLGYTYPSKWTNSDSLLEMAAMLNDYMKRSDMDIATIVDSGVISNLSAFTRQDGIKGLFFIDFGDYSKYKGRILWSDKKPVVTARYRLWAEVADGSIENIAAGINSASTDISSQDAYSFVIVHSWSGLDSSGNLVLNGDTMKGIKALIDRFDSNVDVVTPSEFISRIIKNKVGQ